MRSAIAIVVLLSPGLAFAEEAPVEPGEPWAITGTSTTPMPMDETAGRLEVRLFSKEDHLIVRSGFTYLSRADFYRNPGVSLDVAWYPWEFLGVDIVSSTLFFSQLTDTAAALLESTGLLPDSQKPIARVAAGARFAFAYGKLLIEALETVVHIDASLAAHAGVLVTDEAVNPAGDVALGVQVVAFERLLVWVEGGYLISYESRTTSSVASGPQGTIGLGLLL